MTDNIFILLTAIIFYFIGRNSYKKEAEITHIIEKINKLQYKSKPIEAVNQKSPEERRKEGTDEEAVDNEMSKLFKNIFKKGEK